MLLYSILMFAISILFVVFSILIYRGNTKLIHDYHQTRVKDKPAYGKAFGKALFVFAAAPFCSGIIGLQGDSDSIALAAVVVLVLGLAAGIACIVVVQRKYNQGVF